MTGEQHERIIRGPAGPGMPRSARRAIVFLFALSLLLAFLNLAWTAHAVSSGQAAQRREGQVVERKICATFGALARLKPPAGNPAANPSRAYLQEQHRALVQLGADIGCHQERK